MVKKLIYINLSDSKCLFFEINLSKGNNEYSIITSKGKIGNRGISNIAFKNSDFEKANSFFWAKINEKKSEGYKLIDDVEDNINSLFGIKTCRCDICKKPIDEKNYRKISDFLRKDTIVDKDEKNIAYKKVLCYDCQKKHNIIKFKK